jgi:endonuclease YncB( thermonuclease family)
MDLNIGTVDTKVLVLIIIGICVCAGAAVILFKGGGPSPPTIENFGAYDITTTSATLRADYDTGSWSSVEIRFGYRENFSETWQYTNWHEASGSGRLNKIIVGLSPNTCYEFMIFLQHDSSIIFSPIKKFETQAIPPAIENLEFTDISETSAVLKVDYNCSSYSEINIQFSYQGIGEGSKITEGGTVSESGVFSENLSNLTPSMVYLVQTMTRYDNNLQLDNVKTFRTLPLPGQVSVPNYEAIGTVTSVVDGDTIRVLLTWVNKSKTGVHAGIDESVRFAGGINAPEITGEGQPGGNEAKIFVQDLCPPGSEVLLDLDDGATHGTGPYRDLYGRLLCVIYTRSDNTWVNINASLLRWGSEEYPSHNWISYIGFASEFSPFEWPPYDNSYPYVL